MILSNKILSLFAPKLVTENDKLPKRKLVYCLAGVALFFLLTLLTGCGTAQTDIRLDEGFSGERLIQVSVPSWELNRAKGGQDAVEDLINENVPKALKYTSESKDGNTIFTFSLLFDSPEDYRQKIESLLEANPGNTISPLVVIDSGDSPFKQGFAMRENFTSADLMGWLEYILDEAEILGQKADAKAYCTFNDTTVRYGDKEYTVAADEPLEIDDMQRMTFESITSYTSMLWDGGFERTFSFYISQDNLSQLQDKNVNVQQYLQDLLPAGANLSSSSSTGDTKVYTIVVSAASEEELVAATNSILKTSDNSFSVQILPPEDGKSPQLIINEYLNGSHFLDYFGYYSSPMVSHVQPFPGCTPTSSSAELPSRLLSSNNTVFFAQSIPLNTPVETVFAWNFQFKSLEIQFTLGESIAVQLIFKLPYNTTTHIVDIAKQSLSMSVPNGLALTTQKNKVANAHTFTLTANSGEARQISTLLNDFAKKYTQNFVGVTGGELFRINYASSPSSSFFQPHYIFTSVCDVALLSERSSVQISPAPGYTLDNAPSASMSSESANLGEGVFAASAEVLGLNWSIIISLVALVLIVGLILMKRVLASRPRKVSTTTKKDDASLQKTDAEHSAKK